jgi:hypothetical protein
MKAEILGLIAGILLVGCSKDDNASAPEQDCNCNRVVEVNSFTLADRSTFGTYITINDCTGVQRQYQWQYENNKPKVGSCY